jgi:DNA-directed RNA polymerase subunit alpha
MAIIDFVKPDKVVMLESNDFAGSFEFRPLEPGFGITIGNALRRILLSSLEGFAITSIKIDGVDHEFSTVKGVVEDVTEISAEPETGSLQTSDRLTESEKVNHVIGDQEQFSAGDIGNFTSSFQVLNPDLVICNMDPKGENAPELQVGKGRGYRPAEENKNSHHSVGTIHRFYFHPYSQREIQR